MSTSPVQIKTFEKSEASPQEQSVPWSQQVDEAFFESFVVEQNTDLKTEDFKDSNLITSNHNNFLQKKSSQIRINKGTQIRNYTKISTRNDFRSLTCKPIIKERYPVALERNYSNETMDSKKTTWASIASQPIKSISKGSTIMSNQKKKGPGMPPPPMVPGKHNMDSVSWEFPKNNTVPVESNYTEKELIEKTVEHFSSFMVDKRSINKFDCKLQKVESKLQNKCDDRNINITDEQSFVIEHNLYPENFDGRNEIKDLVGTRPRADILVSCSNKKEDEAVIEPKNVNYSFTMNELKGKNNYNPSDLPLSIATLARFFVIKSYSEDDIHRSIKYEIWCSTDHGNKRLDDAFKERHNKGGSVLLFFSVNGSGHFCGMAQMMTSVDYNSTASVWSQDKWKGKFKVKWIYVKDVPNGQLRHIKLENNDNKSVTNSRDTQEVLNPKGIQVLKIIHSYKHQTSIFDDFYHYEKKQEEEVSKKPFDHTILRHSSQNKNFGDYYKNRNIQERHDFYGDCYTKKVSSIEYDKRISPELPTNREIRGIRHAQRINDSQQEDQVNLKYNRDVDFRELEEYRVGKCSLESNKVR